MNSRILAQKNKGPRFIIVAFTILGLVAALTTPFMINAAAFPRDFDSNAVVYGGAFSKAELISKINNGDTRHNDLKQVFYNENRGISEAGINSSVDGVVKKDGTVWVGGSQVATGVFSSGRSYIPGSTHDGTLWMRPPSVSFLSSQLDAFVLMEGGTFKAAIIKSCGNPIKILAAPFPQVFKRVKNERTGIESDADTQATALAVREGDKVTYTNTVTNQGTASALNVNVKDILPAGVNLGDPNQRDVSMNLGTITALNRKNYLIKVTVATGTAGKCIENVANMTATGGFTDKDSAWICVSAPTPTPRQEQNIKIIKFEDIDHDGIQDVGEKLLPGFTFRLDDGVTKITDANGIVVFNNVSAGNHKIEEINIPSGWIAINMNPFTLNVPEGQTVARLFGNQKLPTPPTPPPTPPTPPVPPAPPAPTPIPTPSGGEVKGVSITKGGLPEAGPAETAAAGAFGFSMLGYSGVYYLKARKRLLMALRKKK